MLSIHNQLFPYFVLLIACAFAVVTDVRSRKIPNLIPAALVSIALIYQACQGWHTLLCAVCAIIVVFFFGTYAFKFGWLGGGDIKLLAAGCAFLPAPEGVEFVLFTTIGGGLLAIVTATMAGKLRTTVASSFTILHGISVDPSTRIEPRTQMKMPYAIAIAFGAVTLTALHTIDPIALRIF